MPSVQVLIANQRIANRKGKIMKHRCRVCGKTFEGSNNSRYCSDQCRETPVYTDEFNGEQFGKLKIINAYRKKRRIYAVCKCNCGNICTVRYDMLQSGNNISCGCENLKTRIQPKDLTGKINEYSCVALNCVGKKEKGYMWECRCKCGKIYTVEASKFYTVKSCGCLYKKTRKENVKKAQEKDSLGYVDGTSVNTIKPGKKMLKNNTSGVTGVSFDKTRGKWTAQIVFKGKNYYLGRYIEKKDAIVARKEAEKHLFGDFLQWFKTEYPERWEKLNK